MKLKFSTELLALGIAHAIYRNTKVEDFHSAKRLMDCEFYKDVYKIVSVKTALLENISDLLSLACKNGLSEDSLFSNEHNADEKDFFLDVLFGIQCSEGWDPPEIMDEKPKDDIAAFFLDGAFKQYCNGASVFDDSVMKPINKDIVNRVYCYLVKRVSV